MNAETLAEVRPSRAIKREEIRVVVGASVGTVLEWYDFFLYGSLAIFFSSHFFPAGSPTAGYLASLATFGVGFVIRPIGAVLFGRFGDKVGRKATFLITIIVMGVSTAGIGFLPSFASIGWASPIILVALRMLQGLALGGEYGGAATYIAEHSRPNRRGLTTGFLQTTATLGFLLSLGVTLICKAFVSTEDFGAWGWRLPFLSSLILLAISTYIRTTLSESPVFARMKAEHRLADSPLRDSFLVWSNVRTMLAVLFGAQAAVGLVWYTCNFYTLYFLTTTLKVPTSDAYAFIVAMLVFSLPLYVLFGWLSDIVGRKWIILAGCGLAVLTFLPIFTQLSKAVNPQLVAFQQSVPIRLAANDCSTGLFTKPATDCDRARDFLTQAGLSYSVEPGSQDGQLVMHVGDLAVVSGFQAANYRSVLTRAGYPVSTDVSQINRPLMYVLIGLLMVWGAMAYGPMSAYYVELFPAKIRYTSISVPYNIGAAVFGGLAPFMSTAIAVKTGNVYYGLWYAIIVGGVAVLIGALFMRESKDSDVTQ
ncbi:MFS transporter [Caballeronia sp. SEWSISQ10-4 2]|uniref:MFS transporter n=1 Tax=Caballeronia sp. SEWSISQ10-4 2 TaxID=2937438 RepID=UPI002652DBBF|nr:MFS transporter [Caballeronia sp. SEWSISQ10-4 2]MDN7178774.1 MFS transporter [Caballeronia sp. SEWSISQ10-4 2]